MGKGSAQLDFYAERFDTVEVNGTFYRLIEVETLRRWREQTPPGFVFACKGSRFLTHIKRLKDTEQGPARFFERVDALEDKLGPVIFQLPGRFKPDRARLAAFLAALPACHRYAFEFRDPAWFEPGVLDLLKERGRGALPLRVRRPGGAARGHRRLRLHPPARPGRPLPGLLRRRGARGPGPSASPPGRATAATSTATSTTTRPATPRRTPCD